MTEAMDAQTAFSGVTKAEGADALDEAKLTAWMTENVAGFEGPLEVFKFAGGQSNPTYRINAKSGSYVLRRKPLGQLLPSAHAVDREFRVLKALHDSGVPVAHTPHLCTDDTVIGSMFYVMSYIDGRVFWDPSLPELRPEQRTALYEVLLRTLAAIHAVDVGKAGLADYGKPGNYFARQLDRWSRQYRDSETQAIPAMEALITQLPPRCPDDDGSIAHRGGGLRRPGSMPRRSSRSVSWSASW